MDGLSGNAFYPFFDPSAYIPNVEGSETVVVSSGFPTWNRILAGDSARIAFLVDSQGVASNCTFSTLQNTTNQLGLTLDPAINHQFLFTWERFGPLIQSEWFCSNASGFDRNVTVWQWRWKGGMPLTLTRTLDAARRIIEAVARCE